MISEQKYTLWPKTALEREEAEAIVAILLDIMRKDYINYLSILDGGSFVLYGTKNGKRRRPKEIIAINFGNGPIKNYVGEDDSYQYATKLLKDVSKNNEKGKMVDILSTKEGKQYLRVKTLFGCFTAILCAEKQDTLVYFAIAEAFANMRRDEETLLRAYVDCLFSEEWESNPAIYFLKGYVNDAFSKPKLPEVKKWKQCYDINKYEIWHFFENLS